MQDDEPFMLNPEDPEEMKEFLRMLQEQMFETVYVPVDVTRLPSDIGASGWTVSHSLE